MKKQMIIKIGSQVSESGVQWKCKHILEVWKKNGLSVMDNKYGFTLLAPKGNENITGYTPIPNC